MDQIATSNKKLELLERTNEIEEEERERVVRNLAQRTEKYKQLKSQNDIVCLRSANQMDLRQEATERRAILERAKDSTSDMPWIKPIIDVLENHQGKHII